MRRVVLLAVIAATLGASSAPAQTRARTVESKPIKSANGPRVAPAQPASFAAIPFSPGETLSYSIDWNNYGAAGHLDLAVAERGKFFGRDGYHLTADAKTVGLVRSLFASVDSHSDTYVDTKTLVTFRSDRDSSFNGRTNKETIVFDQAKGTATAGTTPVEIGATTGDVIGTLYRLRALPLKNGDAITLDGIEGTRRMSVGAKVAGRESVNTPAGTFNAIRVDCTPTRNGQPDETGNFSIYFSDDKARLPVLITAQPTVGSIRVALTAVTNGR